MTENNARGRIDNTTRTAPKREHVYDAKNSTKRSQHESMKSILGRCNEQKAHERVFEALLSCSCCSFSVPPNKTFTREKRKIPKYFPVRGEKAGWGCRMLQVWLQLSQNARPKAFVRQHVNGGACISLYSTAKREPFSVLFAFKRISLHYLPIALKRGSALRSRKKLFLVTCGRGKVFDFFFRFIEVNDD